MRLSMMEHLCETVRGGGEAVLCTVVRESGSTPRSRGAAMIVRPDGTTEGSIGGGTMEASVRKIALDMMRDRRASELVSIDLAPGADARADAVCGGALDIFLERYGAEDEVVVFGAGHVGRAVAKLASQAGFAVSLWDDRDDLTADCSDFAHVVSCPLGEVERHGLVLGASTYAVIVTRGHAMDTEAVKSVHDKGCAYVGMIGSRRKIAYVREQLLAAGVPSEHIDRIRQPIGLPIRAETPEEIAVSIVAEMIAVRRGADVDALRAPMKA